MNFEEHTHTPIAYQKGMIHFNHASYTTPQIIINQQCYSFGSQAVSDLTYDDFQPWFERYGQPELIVLGTGSKQLFAHPKLMASLAAKGIGLECMSSDAACRTWVILQSEQRHIWACLLP